MPVVANKNYWLIVANLLICQLCNLRHKWKAGENENELLLWKLRMVWNCWVTNNVPLQRTQNLAWWMLRCMETKGKRNKYGWSSSVQGLQTFWTGWSLHNVLSTQWTISRCRLVLCRRETVRKFRTVVTKMTQWRIKWGTTWVRNRTNAIRIGFTEKLKWE